MGSLIRSMGIFLPPTVLTNENLEEVLAASGSKTSDEWIVKRTGIRRRHVASEYETVGIMALNAAQDALDNLNEDIPPIEHIRVATNTADQSFPNIAGYVHAGLLESHPSRISANASGKDGGAGCGAINLELMDADHLLRGGQFETALVIGAEKLSDVTDYSDRSTCILFGDGASAYILSRNSSNPNFGFRGHSPRGDGSKRGLIECVDKEKVTLYEALDAVAQGMNPLRTRGRVLKMEGGEVFEYVAREWDNLFTHFQNNSKINPDGISFVDIFGISGHLANLRCFENVEKKYPGFLHKCGLEDLDEIDKFFYNTSTASQGRRTKQLIESAPAGSYLLMHGYGAGLQACANLYRKPF